MNVLFYGIVGFISMLCARACGFDNVMSLEYWAVSLPVILVLNLIYAFKG